MAHKIYSDQIISSDDGIVMFSIRDRLEFFKLKTLCMRSFSKFYYSTGNFSEPPLIGVSSEEDMLLMQLMSGISCEKATWNKNARFFLSMLD